MRAAFLASLLAACAAAAGCGGASTGADPPVPRPSAVVPSRTSHVVVIVMENKEASDVIGAPDAPFVNALARRYRLVRNSFGVTHPSLPNYLALTGGSTFGIDSDCTDCHVKGANLVDQLERAHISWKAYMEGMPRPCFKGAEAGNYAKKHDPFLYYDDVAGNPSRCAHVVPATRLRADLRAGRLPTFAWISPDLCNDTHDCPVSTGDRYLSSLVPALARALGPHGLLVLTWDEGDSDAGCCNGSAHGGRIATIVIGPRTRGSAGSFTHYSTLRRVEEALGLPALRAAASASPLPG